MVNILVKSAAAGSHDLGGIGQLIPLNPRQQKSVSRTADCCHKGRPGIQNGNRLIGIGIIS